MLVCVFALGACAELGLGPQEAEPVTVPAVPTEVDRDVVLRDTSRSAEDAAIKLAQNGNPPLLDAEVDGYLLRLQADLQRAAEASGGTVEREGDAIRLVLPSNNAFAAGDSEIAESYEPLIIELARVLAIYPQSIVEVEGFTDSSGDADANSLLSLQRAETVARLLAGSGVAQPRLVVAGWGEAKPIAPNNTAAGRIRNRRVELRISPHVLG